MRLLNAFVTVCQAVAYAHSQGILHRDLKGGNVILGDFGEVIVLDWGLAKVLDEEGESSSDCGEVAGWRRSWPHAARDGRRHPGLHGPRAGNGSRRPGGHPHRRVWPGGHPLRDPHRSAAIRSARRQRKWSTRPWPATQRRQGSSCRTCLPISLPPACVRLPKNQADATRRPRPWLKLYAWLADTADRSRARQERERFFGLSLDLLCTLGTDGRFHQVNPAWQKSLGWSAAALQELAYFDLIHPDDRDSTEAALAAVAAGSERAPFVNRCRRADGGWRWVSWSVILIRGEHLVYAVGRDVTEQKEAEVALRRSQEHFELAVRGSGVGLWDWDRETGESYYSPRAGRA